jgi:hypothetical protein
MHLGQQNCLIHPAVVSNILDHYLRRPQDQKDVAGALLGYADGNNIDIQTCFGVPLTLTKGEKAELVIDKDYCQKMLKFQRKVNPKEGLVGLYMTGQSIEAGDLTLYTYFQELTKEKKNMSVVKSPLLLLIDPTMKDNKLSIKVSSQHAKFLQRYSACSLLETRLTFSQSSHSRLSSLSSKKRVWTSSFSDKTISTRWRFCSSGRAKR